MRKSLLLVFQVQNVVELLVGKRLDTKAGTREQG